MPQGFEEAVATTLTPAKVRRFRDTAQRVDVALDGKRGSMVTVGDRQWAMVMTTEAMSRWTDLKSADRTRLAVLVYDHPGAAAPFAHRELVLRSTGRALRLEVVDENGEPLWSGKARVDDQGNLHFDMPITRPGTSRKGRMAGHITGNGELVLDKAQLPQPAAQKPDFVAED